MMEKLTPDLSTLSTTFFNVSVSCNCFSNTEKRRFGVVASEGLNYMILIIYEVIRRNTRQRWPFVSSLAAPEEYFH